jgi:hypothetical protein
VLSTNLSVPDALKNKAIQREKPHSKKPFSLDGFSWMKKEVRSFQLGSSYHGIKFVLTSLMIRGRVYCLCSRIDKQSFHAYPQSAP